MRTASQPVAPAEDIGSPDLTDALRTADPASISRALAQGWVVVPLLRTSQGPRIRLVEGLQGRTGWELPVFSSVAALHSFLADDEQRDFDFIPGTALAGLLRDAEDRIARVVFDASEPHAMHGERPPSSSDAPDRPRWRCRSPGTGIASARRRRRTSMRSHIDSRRTLLTQMSPKHGSRPGDSSVTPG